MSKPEIIDYITESEMGITFNLVWRWMGNYGLRQGNLTSQPHTATFDDELEARGFLQELRDKKPPSQGMEFDFLLTKITSEIIGKSTK